jgi:heat-inducible transcriptional repressor
MISLDRRKGRILRIIVTDYVSTAAPVPSSAIVKSGALNVSSATIRNEMVSLEEDGYILRPHIAAGGVPSDKGYRYFVDTLDRDAQSPDGPAAYVQSELQHSRRDFEAWAEAAAAALASLLGTLAFATAPRAASATIKSMEILRLQESVIMLILVLRETSVHREMLSLDSPVSELELERTRNRLAGAVAGKSSRDLAAAALHASGSLEQQVLESAATVLRDRESEVFGERVFQGLGKLLEQPELASRPAQTRKIVAAMEDDGTFASLASRAPDDGATAVLIGTEIPQESLHDFSVVVSRYGIPDEAQGVIGLVSPTRMPYERAIPIVRHTAFSLSELATRVYGG